MGVITFNSTFRDIRDLLINEDDKFIKQCKYLCGIDGETDKGYLVQNFHFFMVIILGGTSYRNEYTKKFLNIAYPNRIGNSATVSSWEQGIKNFIYGKREDLPENFKNNLENMDDSLTLGIFEDGTWIDLRVNDTAIFKKNNNEYYFCSKNNKNGVIRAKESMKQIVDFLVNGVQITSNGGFSYMTDPYTLLITNKQLIMNGAPGTGKTYSARNDIADKLFDIVGKSETEKETVKKIQMDMVQFHPSYDYTDFIEGIRPNLSGQNVGYVLKNGSFKRFCRKAGVVERILASGKSVNHQNIEAFLMGEDEEIIAFWKNEFDKETFDPTKLPPFLFIIDEINRAEISKVLGETMFCLDADYRGVKGKIATQYSSLATDESFYIDKNNDKFFIPSNVYIIGTMNDIDRSVEVFDFALRRRFAWHEVTASIVMEKVLKSMDIDTKLGANYSDYLDKIVALNESISSLLKLNSHYHLGPSYFAKIELYIGGSDYKSAREEVWNNHISQILNEYVKGKRTEAEIEKIGEAFNA